MPKPYLVVKETLLKEAMKQGGNLKKKDARQQCHCPASTTAFR
jgi:transcriptional adapter 2-alpha